MNDHEARARAAKALALLDHFAAVADGLGLTESLPEAIERLDDDAWNGAARVTGVNPPSAKTRDLVLHLARERQRHADERDPFDGLPREHFS